MTSKTWQDKALGLKGNKQSATIADDTEIIILITAVNEFGDPIYGYLKIPFKHYATIKERIETNEGFDPREFGEVVAAGRGLPTPEIEDEIAEEHGIRPVPIKKPKEEPESIPDNFAVQDMDDDDYPF